MVKDMNIKRLLLRSLSCLLGVIIICFIYNDAFAAGCSGDTKCLPGCKYNRVESCTLCPVFVVVFNTVSKIGSISAETFSSSIMTVVVVGFAVWLVLEVIKFVSSMKTKDLKDFMQTLITRSFILMIVLIILKTGVGNFYNVFIQPVYNTGQNMAQMMFEDKTASGSHNEDKKALKDKSITGLKEFKNGLPSSMGASIVKTMTMMENRIRKINALGSALWCQSWKEAFLFIFPKLKYLIFGGAVWVLTVSMMVIIPFLLIDAVFQLGVAAALMPFAVGAYAFEYTRKKYCKKVFDTFLNSAFSFLFLSVIVLMLLGAIQSSVANSVGTAANFDEMFVIGSGAGDIAFTKFKGNLSWGSGFLINLFFVFVLAWSVMDMGKTFAKKFAGTISSTSIGSELGAAAGSAAWGAGTKLTAPARQAVKEGVKDTAKRIGRGINHIASRRKTERMAKRFDNKGSDDGNGNRSYTDKKGKKYTIDKDGNITKTNLKSSKISKDGKTKVEVQEKEIRTKNAVLKITTTTTFELKDGQWVVKDVNVDEKMKASIEEATNIMGKNGKFSPQTMEKLLEGTSGETRDALRNNIMRQITESRLSKAAFDPSKEKLAKPAETTVDKDTGEIITKYTTASGEVIISKTKLRSDGIVESKVVRIENDEKQKKAQEKIDKRNEKIQKIKDGKNDEDLSWFQKIKIKRLNKKIEKLKVAKARPRRVTTFESDGIRNKMTVNLLNEGYSETSFVSKKVLLAQKKLQAEQETLANLEKMLSDDNFAKDIPEYKTSEVKSRDSLLDIKKRRVPLSALSIGNLSSYLQCEDLTKEERDVLKKAAFEKIKKVSKKDLYDRTRGSAEGCTTKLADFDYLLKTLGEDPQFDTEVLNEKTKLFGYAKGDFESGISRDEEKVERAKKEIELMKSAIEASQKQVKEAMERARTDGISIEDIEYNLKRDANGNAIGRTGYAYTEYYKKEMEAGRIKEKEIGDGMFAGDIQRDKNGNIVDGAFVRYKQAVRSDDTMHWSDFNFGAWGRKNRDKKVLNSGHWLKGGNNYESMESDMNFYFDSSDSPKRTKRIFGSIRGF